VLVGRVLYFLCWFLFVYIPFVCVYTMRYKEELDEKLIAWKMPFEILKNSQNFISLFIKCLHVKVEYYPSYFSLKCPLHLTHK
jgi:hypothetical protein